jgi:hypothetical protein
MRIPQRFSRCAVLLLLIVSAHFATGQETRARLEGAVKDGSKPFSGALVLATDSESVWHIKTDAKGEFALFVPSGCYDVMLSSHFFNPKTKHFCVQAGEAKKLSFKVRVERLLVSK